MTTTTESLSTRLRAAADDIQFQGRPDPHDDKALMRIAAEQIEFYQRASAAVRLAELEASKIPPEAVAEWHQLGMWLVTTFQPGAVDEAAVLCPGGEYESGPAFVRRALQLALERGAFAPGQHIQTEQGPMLLAASQLGPVLAEVAQNARIMAGNLIGAREYGPEVQQAALSSAATLLDEIAETLEPVREDTSPDQRFRVDENGDLEIDDGQDTLRARIRAALGAAGQENNADTRAKFRDDFTAFLQALPRMPAPRSEVTCVSTPEQLAAGEMVFKIDVDRETLQAVQDSAARAGLTSYLRDVGDGSTEAVIGRPDRYSAVDLSPAGQARRALQRLGPTVAGVGGSIKLAAAIGIGPACGLSIDEFRPLLAAWNAAGTPRWANEAIELRLVDRYAQHKADFFADVPTTGPTSTEPEQDPAMRLLPRDTPAA